VNAKDLEARIGSLRTWSRPEEFSSDDYRHYITTAKMIQETYPPIVEAALAEFISDASREAFTGYESESKPFLLMRVLFDLPEIAGEQSRLIFKGWTNWPAATADGNVNLSWPISWRSGSPELIASYSGSEGKPYDAVGEYRYFRKNFPYRPLENIVIGPR